MDLNNKARKQIIEVFSSYLKRDKNRAIKLAEEVYETFSAATESLLDKATSEAVNLCGELWIKGDISKEKVQIFLKKLQENQK